MKNYKLYQHKKSKKNHPSYINFNLLRNSGQNNKLNQNKIINYNLQK